MILKITPHALARRWGRTRSPKRRRGRCVHIYASARLFCGRRLCKQGGKAELEKPKAEQGVHSMETRHILVEKHGQAMAVLELINVRPNPSESIGLSPALS